MRHDVGPTGVYGIEERQNLWDESRRKAWIGQLTFGLKMLDLHYATCICYMCGGTGRLVHVSASSSTCDCCNGSCLVQRNGPAPASLTVQVFNAGKVWELFNDVQA